MLGTLAQCARISRPRALLRKHPQQVHRITIQLCLTPLACNERMRLHHTLDYSCTATVLSRCATKIWQLARFQQHCSQ